MLQWGGTHQAIEESKELGLNEDILTEALSLVLKTVLNPQISLAYSCFTIFCLWQAAFFPEGPLKRPQVVSLVTNGILQELVRKMFERNIKVTQANVFKLFPPKKKTCLLLQDDQWREPSASTSNIQLHQTLGRVSQRWKITRAITNPTTSSEVIDTNCCIAIKKWNVKGLYAVTLYVVIFLWQWAFFPTNYWKARNFLKQSPWLTTLPSCCRFSHWLGQGLKTCVFQSGVSKGNIRFSHLSAKKTRIFGTENHVAKDGWYHLRISIEPKTLVSKVIPCPLVARGSPFLFFSGKRLFKLGIFSGRNFFNQDDGRFRHPVLAAKFLNR